MPVPCATSASLTLRITRSGSDSQALSTRSPPRTMALTEAASSPLPAAPPSAKPHPPETGNTS